MSSELERYVLAHIDPEPEHLYRLWRATNVELLNGRMARVTLGSAAFLRSVGAQALRGGLCKELLTRVSKLYTLN